jgi:alginate O-acetyltransferase complex protein AlgI
MTLSRWLRDYVYKSLGANKKGEKIAMRNIFLTMMIGGIWHGASWNFAFWGMMNGVALIIENFNSKYQWIRWNLKNPLVRFIKWLLIFHFLCLAGIFFRASNFESAQQLFLNILSFDGEFILPENNYFMGIFILLLPVIHWSSARLAINHRCGDMSSAEYIAWMVCLSVLLLLYGGGYSQEFFYFQF